MVKRLEWAGHQRLISALGSGMNELLEGCCALAVTSSAFPGSRDKAIRTLRVAADRGGG